MIDAKKINLRKEVEALKKISGKERGIDIKYLVDYVEKKEGKEGLDKVLLELEKNGYKLPDLSKIGNMDWISVSIPSIFLVACVKCFNWQEDDIIEMGKGYLSFSSVIKIFIKYFVSLEKTFKMAARSWRKYYTVGEISVKYNKKKPNEIIINLLNFKKHPFSCIYLKGSFSKLVEIMTGKKVIKALETKCPFNGDSYHEYKITWQNN